MKTFIKFYQYSLRYRWRFIAAIILVIAFTIAGAYGSFYFRYFYDAIANKQLGDSFLWLIGGYVLVNLIFHALRTIAYLVTDGYLLPAARDLRTDVFKHLHNLDFSFHASKQSGSLISAIKRGDSAFFEITHALNNDSLSIIVEFIFIVVAFFTINPFLSFIALASVLINLLLAVVLIRTNLYWRRKFNEDEDQVSAVIIDNLINFETVKFFAKEKWEAQRLATKFKDWINSLWGYSNTFRYIDVSVSSLSIISATALIYVSYRMLIGGQISAGDFILLLALLANFYPKFGALIMRFRDIAKHLVDLEKYLNILSNEVEVKQKKDAVEIRNIKGKIEFKQVGFAYKERSRIINGFNLTIAPGQAVAFVGTSGAGKSTLVKLLLRFYDVNAGKITIDDFDIRDLTKDSLRANIGVVPQEPVLFNDTIGYNIGYAKPGAELAEIKQAAKLANLNRFIESLPLKYETLVGERGIKLSGGQKQRLAIARMFLANPHIIVFDEATSQLDSESEKMIQDAFWKIAKDKTTLIIAHRLSTVMRADRIVVIDKGKIVEDGSHAELIKKTSGIYKKLWTLQRGGMLMD